MLAQLQERADVETAEVDRRGQLLRIRPGVDGAATAITEELARMGFAAEEHRLDTSGIRWYGTAEVGELSREEAAVIAARVVPAFIVANGLDRAQVELVSTLVADALYVCFIARRDVAVAPGGLAIPCGRAVEEATRSLLGADRASALGRAIEADLAT